MRIVLVAMSEYETEDWGEMTGEEVRAIRKSRQAPGKARILPTYVKIKTDPFKRKYESGIEYIERSKFNDVDTLDYIMVDDVPNSKHYFFEHNNYDTEDITHLAKKVYVELVIYGDSDVMCTYVKREKYQKAGDIKYELIEHWKEKRLPIPELETRFKTGYVIFSSTSRGFNLISEMKFGSQIADKPPACIGTVFAKNIIFDERYKK